MKSRVARFFDPGFSLPSSPFRPSERGEAPPLWEDFRPVSPEAGCLLTPTPAGREFGFDLDRVLGQAAHVEESFPGHARVVARYALLLAHTLGLTDEFFLRELERGAHLHDIGKAGIPRSILCKAGPLTPLEREIMKDHPLIGCGMLRGLGAPPRVTQVVLYHHERHDGRGYPFGLTADDIPLQARIIALADALDAITSDRPYRPRSSFARARREIAGDRRSKFDPDLVDAFLSISDEVWQGIKYRGLFLLSVPPTVH